MATLDITKAVDRVRLAIADYVDPIILPDNTIQFYLDKNLGNEASTTRECAAFILAALSRQGRQRLDRIELFGSEVFNNYLKYLEKVINNPNGQYSLMGIYAGGVDVDDVVANCNDATIVHHSSPVSECEGYVVTTPLTF